MSIPEPNTIEPRRTVYGVEVVLYEVSQVWNHDTKEWYNDDSETLDVYTVALVRHPDNGNARFAYESLCAIGEERCAEWMPGELQTNDTEPPKQDKEEGK